jgi:hypothetical protein
MFQRQNLPSSTLPHLVSSTVPYNPTSSPITRGSKEPTIEDDLLISRHHNTIPSRDPSLSTILPPWSVGAVIQRTRDIEAQNAARTKALELQRQIDAANKWKELLEANKAERRWVLWSSVQAEEWRANLTEGEELKENDEAGVQHSENSFGFFPAEASFASNEKDITETKRGNSSWVWPDGDTRSWADLQGLYGLGYSSNENGRRERKEHVGWGDGVVVEVEQ